MSTTCYSRECTHAHGEHDKMNFCGPACRCYFAMRRAATEAIDKLAELGDVLGHMRWAWDKNDSRHARAVELSMETEQCVERLRHFREPKP